MAHGPWAQGIQFCGLSAGFRRDTGRDPDDGSEGLLSVSRFGGSSGFGV